MKKFLRIIRRLNMKKLRQIIQLLSITKVEDNVISGFEGFACCAKCGQWFLNAEHGGNDCCQCWGKQMVQAEREMFGSSEAAIKFYEDLGRREREQERRKNERHILDIAFKDSTGYEEIGDIPF